MTFTEGSGFARWADTNRLIILFPQVEASILNPKACWDWWGYTGKDFLTKDAPQIAAIWRMVEQLARATRLQKPRQRSWNEDARATFCLTTEAPRRLQKLALRFGSLAYAEARIRDVTPKSGRAQPQDVR